MAGGVGNPLIVDTSYRRPNVNPANGPTPNGAQGRIVLAVPTPTGNAAEDAVYEGWLYAAVSTPTGALDGLFVTKDFGQNWTQVRIPTVPPVTSWRLAFNQAIPTNDVSQPDYPILGGGGSLPAQGNYDIALAVDPDRTPTSSTSAGPADGSQTGLIRIDTTSDLGRPLAGRLRRPGHRRRPADLAARRGHDARFTVTPTWLCRRLPSDGSPYLNFIRNPHRPLLCHRPRSGCTTTPASPTTAPASSGSPSTLGGTDYHRAVSIDRSDDRAAPAYHRQRPGRLQRSGQQRAIPGQCRRDRLPRCIGSVRRTVERHHT